MQFTGQYADATGLTHMRARQYDPTLGQFTSSDPWQRPADQALQSRYQYADGAPTTLIDPTGLCGIGDLGSLDSIMQCFDSGAESTLYDASTISRAASRCSDTAPVRLDSRPVVS